jgi:hypothetical protein
LEKKVWEENEKKDPDSRERHITIIRKNMSRETEK